MQDTKTKQFINTFREEIKNYSLPQKLADTYTLTSVLKEISDKHVYLLSDIHGTSFILKSCRGMFRSSLKQEYDILSQASSNHFPTPLDFFEEEETSFLLRSYVHGPLLSDFSEQLCEKQPCGTAFESLILPLFIQCCDCIQVLHALHPPVIHRDIKPENFIWDNRRALLVLIDVDAGRQFLPEKSRDTIFVGTYGNAAPEQFGFSQSDVRTDVYGLGKTFLSLLGDSSCASPELSIILKKATAFEPERRYASVKEFSAALLTLQKKRSHMPSHSFLKYPLLILFAGLVAGSAIGSGIGVMVSQKLSSVPNSQTTGSVPSTQSDHTLTGFRSLADNAGVQDLNLYNFQDDVDAIILAAFNNDADALTQSIESLITGLYAEPELTRNPPEDYAAYDHIPESEITSSPVDIIRQRLVYRDCCLKKTVGSYDQYKYEILSLLRLVLYRTSDADSSCIYIYSHTSPENVQENVYLFCISDLLDNIQLAIDNKDQFVRAYEQNQ